MTSILLKDLEQLDIGSDDSEERLIISGVSWEQYERLLERLGNSSRYRVSYLDGTLEIMSPSREHEVNKKNIGRLLEAYLEKAEIDFWGLGSTTLRREEKKGGKEPDESYCIDSEKEFPDLAIEVIKTSGGVNILEIYQRLGIKEVWLWQNNQFSLYGLRGDNYQPIPQSELLPNLDLTLLAKYVTHPNPRQALREFRDNLA